MSIIYSILYCFLFTIAIKLGSTEHWTLIAVIISIASIFKYLEDEEFKKK